MLQSICGEVPDGHIFTDQSVCNLHTGANTKLVHWKGRACEERRRPEIDELEGVGIEV